MMRTDWNENRALLRGRAGSAPVFSHENHGTVYEVFSLLVPRLSGTEDRLNVVVPQPLLACCPVREGMELEVRGDVRSFNNRSDRGSRLVITVLARELCPTREPPANELVLSGALCKPPVLRRTPLGREICDLLLAVNRRYGRADYLPCIAWGALARSCGALDVGSRVKLDGRLQSRAYQKVTGGVPQTRTAFEISVMALEPEETMPD